MTAIDGARQAGTIHDVAGPVLDRIDDLSRILGRSPAEVVALAFDKFAPPVETRSAAASPGDRAGHRGSPPAPVVVDSSGLPFHDVSEVIAQPIPHIHVGLNGRPCVYGDRCSTGIIA